jgi:hypothetical protein
MSVTPDDPASLRATTPLGVVIAKSITAPVHIVFVHGMRAEGAGASEKFRAGLLERVPKLRASAPTRSFLAVGTRPAATYVGEPIWKSDEEWQASRPFVDRYVFARAEASPIVVDEVNWWPLLFPPKCRFILLPETDLSGVDQGHIKLCGRHDPPYYPWLSEKQVAAALAHKPASGGGARINASIKQQIMNWGLTDAVLALGPMRTYCRQALNQAFGHASSYDGKGVTEQEFVVVSESLGSFVVLDAFGDLFGDSHEARSVGERTADLYFFANQFALLELARIGGISDGRARTVEGAGVPVVSPLDLLRSWALSGSPLETVGRLKQVVAFSDPSDLLTFRVPKLRNSDGKDIAIVVNVYDHNEIKWLGIFANPTTAHTGHSGNKDVLDLIFRTQQ